MEGARLRSSVALPRVAAQPTVVEDNGEKLTIKAGQVVMCNLVSHGWMSRLFSPSLTDSRSLRAWILLPFQIQRRSNLTVT
jgi:hypothetical protein